MLAIRRQSEEIASGAGHGRAARAQKKILDILERKGYIRKSARGSRAIGIVGIRGGATMMVPGGGYDSGWKTASCRGKHRRKPDT